MPKITIISPDPPYTRGYNIESEGKKLTNANGGIFPRDFSESEIMHLLGSDYSKFEKGKYEFNISAWKLSIVTGSGLSNMTPEQNNFSLQYAQIKS